MPDRVRVEPEALELGHLLGQRLLEALRPGAEARDLGRAARRAELGRRLAAPAVVAVEPAVAVERQRDVAVRTAQGEAARAAMQRGRDARGG